MGHWHLVQVRHASSGARTGIKIVPSIEALVGEKTTKQSQSLGVYYRASDLH